MELKHHILHMLSANAYVSGMREDLSLESAAYNWAKTASNIGAAV